MPWACPPVTPPRAPAISGPTPALPKIYGFYQKSWGLYDEATVLDYRVANALQMEVIDRALARFFGRPARARPL